MGPVCGYLRPCQHPCPAEAAALRRGVSSSSAMFLAWAFSPSFTPRRRLRLLLLLGMLLLVPPPPLLRPRPPVLLRLPGRPSPIPLLSISSSSSSRSSTILIIPCLRRSRRRHRPMEGRLKNSAMHFAPPSIPLHNTLKACGAPGGATPPSARRLSAAQAAAEKEEEGEGTEWGLGPVVARYPPFPWRRSTKWRGHPRSSSTCSSSSTDTLIRRARWAIRRRCVAPRW